MAARHSRYAPVYEYEGWHITAAGVAVPVGGCVATTCSSAISAGAAQVVTPASMSGIVVGMLLNIANGSGTAEDITVKSVTATTFTADFAYAHSGAYTIISLRGTFVGPCIINQPGSNTLLTLYNGHPQSSHTSKVIGILNPGAGLHAPYLLRADSGLFYTLAVTGTAPDLTLHYLDMPA